VGCEHGRVRRRKRLPGLERAVAKRNKPSGTEGEPFPSNPVAHPVHRCKPLRLGGIRETSYVYPSVERALQSEKHPMLQITV
jgi:hypothetical protein